MAYLEHANITVSDPLKTANMFVALFDWKIRWQGPAIFDGFTIHVGTDDSYLAIYKLVKTPAPKADTHRTLIGLNHVGIVVDDLDLVERRVKAMGFSTFAHEDYDPGRRFYFHGIDELEIEVICYA